MPYRADDTHYTEKKKHIGNDNVLIVYNDSSQDYHMSTIKVFLPFPLGFHVQTLTCL